MIGPNLTIQTPANSQEPNPNQYMYLNNDFTKIQSCLYSLLKAKKKLKVFKRTYECSTEKFEEIETKLNGIYSELIDIIDAHSICTCSEDDTDDDSDDSVN